MFFLVLSLILGGGFVAQNATGSVSVLLTVSGGVFLVALFAKQLAVALPIAAGTGLLTFAIALREFIPWVGVAEGLLLIAWAGSARVRRQPAIPAALTSGFFGALILAFEVWRGMAGELLPYETRPLFAIAFAAVGCALLLPCCIEIRHRVVRTVPRRLVPRRTRALRWAGGFASLAVAIALTGLLAGPMHTYADRLREALGGTPEREDSSGGMPTHGQGGRTTSEGSRSLPRTADIDLDHHFELLIRTDNSTDAQFLAGRQIYCRTMVFDEYRADSWLAPEGTSSVWREDNDDGTFDGKVQLGPAPDAPVRVIPHTVYVPQAPDIVLPTLQGVFEFELSRVIRIGSSGFGHLARPDRSLMFSATSGVMQFDDLPSNLAVASPSGSGNDLQLPNDRTGGLIRQLGGSLAPVEASVAQKIEAVRSHLHRTTSYSTVIENPDDLPPLENFLFGEKRGYCEFYASAGALLLRALGVPARTGYGFSGGELTSDPQSFAFFSDDGHAWTEVHIEGVGWCVVDFTPEGLGAASPPGPADPQGIPFDPESFESLNELDGANDTSFANLDMGGSNYNWFLILACALFICGIATVFLRRPGGDSIGKTGQNGSAKPPPPEPGFYRQFCDAAARLGTPKLPGQTPKEHLAILAETRPEQSEAWSEIVDYYYEVRYEGAKVDRARERDFRNLIGKLQQS